MRRALMLPLVAWAGVPSGIVPAALLDVVASALEKIEEILQRARSPGAGFAIRADAPRADAPAGRMGPCPIGHSYNFRCNTHWRSRQSPWHREPTGTMLRICFHEFGGYTTVEWIYDGA